MDGRQWLAVIVDVCVGRIRRDDPAFAVTSPSPASGEHAADVLAGIDAIAPAVTAATEAPLAAKAYGVAAALRLAVRHVGPDLAFRLLLRVVYAYSLALDAEQYARYESLGRRFGYGAHHVELGYDNTGFST